MMTSIQPKNIVNLFLIGYSRRKLVCLIVSFTERAEVIRIISARKADGDERRDYEQVGR